MRQQWPNEVQERRAHVFVRKVYYTAGVNDVWVFDQHDKDKVYHVYYHVGMDPFSGRVLWHKAWWTNRNPRLVCSWFCDVVEELQGENVFCSMSLNI